MAGCETLMQPETIQVTLNGERIRVSAGQSVAALLASLRIPPDRVAVELNKSIVRKRDWERTPVPDASQMEVVEFVGGG